MATELTFKEIFRRVAVRVWHLLPTVESERHAILMLTTFQRTHGDDAVRSMYGFIRWCEENIPDEQSRIMQITVTLAHDIGGRNDKRMLPRSDGYIQFINL